MALSGVFRNPPPPPSPTFSTCVLFLNLTKVRSLLFSNYIDQSIVTLMRLKVTSDPPCDSVNRGLTLVRLSLPWTHRVP